ncbi:hypothetical protein BUE80_DR001067 [Diplocarpon rosae]|nr:hypothetical protein BUE80_DR001067 [Diplocarpon rosae]
MGLSRKSKRSRTKPPSTDEQAGSSKLPVEESSSTKPSISIDKSSGVITSNCQDAPTLLKSVKSDASSKTLNAKSSWYGTWPRKSTASTQVARESILADKPTNASTVDLSRFEPKKSSATAAARPPSMYLGKSKETIDVTMGGTLDVDGSADKNDKPMNQTSSTLEHTRTEPPRETLESENETSKDGSPPKFDATARPATSSGWLGSWLSRPTGDVPTVPHKAIEVVPTIQTGDKPAVGEQQLSEPASLTNQIQSEGSSNPVPPPTSSSSWFGLWTAAVPSHVTEAWKKEVPVMVGESASGSILTDPSATPSSKSEQPVPAPGSSWAFWSSDSNKKIATASGNPDGADKLAVIGESSQDKPQPAKTATFREGKKSKSGRRGRPQSTEADTASLKVSQSESSNSTSSPVPPAGKSSPPNLLIPSVRSTYSLIENPSILQQISQILLRGHQKPVKHVYLTREAPKIKKALAIGIHGLFPAPLLRTVIGQPTGTSIRFANHAAEAIRRWTDNHGCMDCEIERVALEGEGKIAERVDNLWKLLLNWIDHVRKADFVLIACHSQGVPVALMLVAKLIEFGVVTSGKIGVCAMAGVSLGPFADYKSRLFSGSAGELFEFASPESTVSKRYEESIKVAVKYGVRVTYCGSIDDQLVSMESSIFSTVSHPYIFRAVFVDGRIHAPDLQLRNLGVSDHGLIRELSAPLAGSLYTGEGHSRLYDDGNVYDLAVEFALETTSVGDVPLETKKYEIPTNANPYVLPWIMRGLLEEDFVKTELDQETTQLLKQFDDWKPATKVLKDVKYRLEAVRSKL